MLITEKNPSEMPQRYSLIKNSEHRSIYSTQFQSLYLWYKPTKMTLPQQHSVLHQVHRGGTTEEGNCIYRLANMAAGESRGTDSGGISNVFLSEIPKGMLRFWVLYGPGFEDMVVKCLPAYNHHISWTRHIMNPKSDLDWGRHRAVLCVKASLHLREYGLFSTCLHRTIHPWPSCERVTAVTFYRCPTLCMQFRFHGSLSGNFQSIMGDVSFTASIHRNENVIMTKFSSLAALLVVILTTSNAASHENFIKMTTFPFQCNYIFSYHVNI